MKSILPWLVAVLALGGAITLWSSNNSKTAEVAKLQQQVQEMEPLRAEIEALKQNQVPAEEIKELRKDKEDLIRLRNEMRQLRGERDLLSKQAANAQAALTGVRQQQQEQLQQLQTQNQQLLGAVQRSQQVDLANVCINNLRQIDGAKQQWALEHQKTPEALPAAEDLSPYIKDNVIPTCPSRGEYRFNTVKAVPTCSIPGHALPQ